MGLGSMFTPLWLDPKEVMAPLHFLARRLFNRYLGAAYPQMDRTSNGLP